MHKRFMVSFLSAVVIVAACAAACRAATVTIAHKSGGVYEVQGAGLSSVAGVDLQISYDTATLASPTVAKGSLASNALMDSNTASAGTIRMAVITTRPITGSGVIATITFRLVGSSSGKILSMTASLIDKSGTRLNSQVRIINPVDSTRSDAGGTANGAASGDTSSASSASMTTPENSAAVTDMGPEIDQPSNAMAAVPGTARGQAAMLSGVGMSPGAGGPDGMPASAPAPGMMSGGEGHAMTMGMPGTPPGEEPVPGMPATAPGAGSAPAKSVASLPAGNASGTRAAGPHAQTVLDRFRTYGGQRTVAAYAALFDQPVSPECRQEPSVGLSDGISTVRLILARAGSGSAAPNFAFSGASLVSMKKGAGNSWVIEVRPEKGVNSAMVTALVDSTARKFPLTVAQPLEMRGGAAGLKATEKDFAVFLKQRATDKAPLYDLNRDGRRDYVDEYIFTANYVVAAGKTNNAKQRSPK